MNRLLFAVATACLAALPALTAQTGAPPDRSPNETTEPAGNAAWQRFVAETPGPWRARWCAATGTPSAIFGAGLPLSTGRIKSMAAAREAASAVLTERGELLGLGTSQFRETIAQPIGWTFSFVFEQHFRGLPVIGGRADVRVSRAGRIAMFGSRAWPVPADFSTTPAIDEITATAIAWDAAGVVPPANRQPGQQRKPRLVIWGDVHATDLAPFALAYEIPISAIAVDGAGTVGRSFVDATTGAVLRFENDRHECGFPGCDGSPHRPNAAAPATSSPAAPLTQPIVTTGIVRAWTRLGTSALAPLTLTPLGGVRVTVPGKGIYTTNTNGEFFVNLMSPVNVTVELRGEHLDLVEGSSRPIVPRTMYPGVTQQFTFGFNQSPPQMASHPTTYYWVHRAAENLRNILGNSSQLATLDQVEPTVNIASTCNAYYTNNSINFYAAGGSCNNTAFSSVIVHELGHGLDDVYGGISQIQGLSEGWADALAMYVLADPKVGEDLTTGYVIRDGTNTVQYPTTGGVHHQGKTWMGFAWKLRERLITTLGNSPTTIALANRIVIGTIAANATNQPDAVLEVFLADDDDGSLANGTPHAAEITWAANQHSLPVPSVGPPANDGCVGAIPLMNGLNGPFTTAAATVSSAWPCGNVGRDVWFSYEAGVPGNLTVQTCGLATFDTAIQIFSGTCRGLLSLGCNDDGCGAQSLLTVPVQAGTHYIRVGSPTSRSGGFQLAVSGPPSASATLQPYGTGCYRTSRSIYEFFDHGPDFDLDTRSVKLDFRGDHYVAQNGGPFIPPPGSAVSLGLTNLNRTALVNLPNPLTYPGGATPRLSVDMNGFVAAQPGNPAAAPTPFEWLNSTAARWGTWHAFWKLTNQPGDVLVHTNNGVTCITWDRMYAYNTPFENTFQLQFDTNSDNVTLAWRTMQLNNSTGCVVGFAAAGPSTDTGSRDLSTQIPVGIRTWPRDTEALALSGTLPQLGTTLVLTTDNYPVGSQLGVQMLSFTRINRGPDLGQFGMPGCYQYVGPGVNVIMLPINGKSNYLLPIPAAPGFIGVEIAAQSAAIALGANSTGIITSNGVEAFLGL
ncbi:MAG: hypothetical protein NXI31_14535 [bacterium]|nr:hypothetical protein [bacterium]